MPTRSHADPWVAHEAARALEYVAIRTDLVHDDSEDRAEFESDAIRTLVRLLHSRNSSSHGHYAYHHHAHSGSGSGGVAGAGGSSAAAATSSMVAEALGLHGMSQPVVTSETVKEAAALMSAIAATAGQVSLLPVASISSSNSQGALKGGAAAAAAGGSSLRGGFAAAAAAAVPSPSQPSGTSSNPQPQQQQAAAGGRASLEGPSPFLPPPGLAFMQPLQAGFSTHDPTAVSLGGARPGTVGGAAGASQGGSVTASRAATGASEIEPAAVSAEWCAVHLGAWA